MFWQPPTEASRWPRYVPGTAHGRKPYRPPAELLDQPFELVDATTGEHTPYQIETLDDPQAAYSWASERAAMALVPGADAYRRQLVFVARDLPAVGYRVYRIQPLPGDQRTDPARAQPGDGIATPDPEGATVVLESPYYRVCLDGLTGAIGGIKDLLQDREVFDGQAPHPPGALVVRDAATGVEELAVPMGISSMVRGPVFSRVQSLVGASCCPRIVIETTLYQEIPRVDIAFRILRDATPMREVYIAFPFAVPDPVFHFEAANALVEPIRDQVPGSNTDTYAVQHWVTVDSATEDWSVVWSPLDTPIAELGGLWPGYVSGAHHGATGPGYGHPFLCEGELTKGYIYALVSYNNFRTNFVNVHPDEFVVRYSFATARRGTPETASAFGWGLQTSPETVWMPGIGLGGGQRPSNAWLTLTGEDGNPVANVLMLVVKRAEDDQGFIVRLWESAGKDSEVTLRPAFLRLEAAFLCDLVERRQMPLDVAEGTVTIRCKSYGIETVRLLGSQRLGPDSHP